MIDYKKLELAHDLVKKYRFEKHRFILLQTEFLGTDIGSGNGIIEDYVTMDYILHFNHETRRISSSIDEIIEMIQEKIDKTYPEENKISN